MTWNPLDEPADKIWLQQHWSPGLCEISGAGSPRKWDEIESHGHSGATLKFKGVGLAHFSVKISLYTAQDWIDWSQFKPLVDKPPLDTAPKAMDIWHPLLVDQGIYAVGVEDLGQPEQTDDGVWTIDIKFVEHRAPKPALVKVKGSTATPKDPDDPVQKEIDQLAKQKAELAAQVERLKAGKRWGSPFGQSFPLDE